MSWYQQWSDGLKKRACRYLLHRYLGQFLEEKLSLDQLSVDLYNGRGSVSEVLLDVEALNDLGEQKNMPIEFVDGFVSEMSVSIPWSQLFTESSYVEVRGLRVIVQPKVRPEEAASLFESVWSSMTSSMQIAAECLQGSDEKEPHEAPPMEGLEIFAQAIESVLTRVKMKFIDTVVRIEHFPKGGVNGIAAEIRISTIDYCDEASGDMVGVDGIQPTLSNSFMVKKFHCEGVSFYSDEFPTEERTFSRGLFPEPRTEPKDSCGPVVIGKMFGKQEVRFKLKIGDSVPGPKVDLELNLGSVAMFLSPRQVHLVRELVGGLAAPESQDGSNVAHRRACQKPMRSEDFEKVEAELAGVGGGGAVGPKGMPRQGWTSWGSVEESDDEFLPVARARGDLSESTASLSLDSMESSLSSSLGSKSKRTRTLSEGDSQVELTAGHLRLASLGLVLLHEDLLTPQQDLPGRLTSPSLATMSSLADSFFSHLERVPMWGSKDFETARQTYGGACQRSHLRLLVAAVMGELNESGNSCSSSLTVGLTASRAELLEFLEGSVSSQTVELLTFSSSPTVLGSGDPDLRVHYKGSRKVRAGGRATTSCRELTLSLGPGAGELDLSLPDRLAALATPQQLCTSHYIPPNKSSFNQAVENSNSVECKSYFKILSPFFIIKFRFPIPDLRPVNDTERNPWWERSVRKDILYFNLAEPAFLTVKDSKTLYQTYQVYAKEVTAIFHEGDTPVGIPFARATNNELKECGSSPSKIGQLIGLPRITFKMFPRELMGELEEGGEGHPSPFTSKRVVHETGQGGEAAQVLPGDKAELQEFMGHATRTAQLQVEVSLPFLALHFPSKHLYELLYNRINGDLSLWQSTSRQTQEPLFPSFSLCKSAIQLSDLDSDEEREEQKSVFYSAYERSEAGPPGQSRLALKLSVSQAVVSLSTSHSCGGQLVPSQLMFSLEDASVFTVTCYRGLAHTNYVCLQVEEVALSGGESPAPSPLAGPPACRQPLGVPTIYRSEEGVAPGGADMLRVAVSTSLADRIKTVRVACCLQGATLRHRVTPSGTSWLSQLLDFFDVIDYPVRGYSSPQVITELHQHLVSCAVDYRPLYLPLRAVITLGGLSLSSNMAARTKGSSLRFIAEDSCLFISDKVKGDKVHLKAHYVSVLEVGLFELQLRLSEAPNCPKVDLKASNNALHIRTCADSAEALARLITYFASDGDLGKRKGSEEGGEEDGVTCSQAEHVNLLMEEAMEELGGEGRGEETNGLESPDQLPAHIFTFPDERGPAVDWATSDPDSDTEFCFLDHETGSGIMPRSGLPEVRILSTQPLLIVDNHFSLALGRADLLRAPKNYPIPTHRYTLRDMTLVWHMYGGQDFSNQHKKTVTIDVVPKKDNFSVSYSSKRGKGESKGDGGGGWEARGGPGRDHSVLMELHLRKVRFVHELYPQDAVQASRQVLLIQEVELRDRLASSEINKFLYLYSSEALPKQSQGNMVLMKAVHLRAEGGSESCVKVSLLPLRLNIDQDSLLFLVSFLSSLSGLKKEESGVPTAAPLLTVGEGEGSSAPVPSKRSPLYVRSFTFSPEVPIRIDYVGKRVDMSRGSLAGLLMGLGQLSCLQIRLKRVSHRQGFLGLDRLASYLFSEWLLDIKKNQVPSLIGGVGPMHSLVQLLTGIRDLFWLPIEQYQRDGRIVRGLQRGANSFTTSTAMAALELTARIVQAIQSIAEMVFDIVSPGPGARRLNSCKRRPADIREGVTYAYQLVKEGLGETAERLVRVASVEAEQKGPVGAVGGVLRQIPPTVVAPIILASAATSNLLGGVRSQLAPDLRREASFKWKDGS